MSEKLLLIDIDKCVGCYACEIACKEEHNLPLESRWCRVVTIGPRKAGDGLHMDIVPIMCIHCDDPICAYFCPVGAIEKRQDGIVIIDEDKCNGCKLCLDGCPYGAIYFNKEKKVAEKCNLCVGRTDDGLEPSCVQHCIGGALEFVTPEELEDITKGVHKVRMGRVCYSSSKWKLHSKVG